MLGVDSFADLPVLEAADLPEEAPVKLNALLTACSWRQAVRHLRSNNTQAESMEVNSLGSRAGETATSLS